MVSAFGNLELINLESEPKRPSYWNTRLWNNFDPAGLTQRLTEVGHLSADFDSYEAMALAGEIIILLSYRVDPRSAHISGLHSFVSSYLIGKGYQKAASYYDSFYEDLACPQSSLSHEPGEFSGLSETHLSDFSREHVEVFLEELEDITR